MDSLDRLERTIRMLGEKATQGMNSLLSKSLIPPIDPSGIISKTNLIVNRMGTVITIATQFPGYAYWVEHGRRPGKMPPEKPIADWVQKHNISPDAVFPIRKKIAEEGTSPRPFTEPLRRMIEMITKTCLQWNAKFVMEETKSELSTLEDVEISL